MHYKIASLVLNAGKHQNGCREVHITQPDALKENVAGKLFLLAEIDGKKPEVKKVIDFIIESLEDFYYNDEKIFLLDKIEGLTLENIFEAALAKLNRALLEFLAEEKIFLRAEDTNLVIGLLFEDKLYFSNFGRNKALLIYKHQDEYDLINVEASAADAEETSGPAASGPKFFSSVITGKIPASSFFLFCNEALPEYLSNKDLITIITKLPPMVAAEQIKGSLLKVNTYVPFLGIIVKNTYGLTAADLKDDLGNDGSQSAHNSISHLNYTERKTEQMLAPAGLINWKKVGKIFLKAKSKISPANTRLKMKSPSASVALPPLSRQATVSASRLIKEKMAFGRSHRVLNAVKTVGITFANLFNPLFWKHSFARGKVWLKSLHPRNRSMFVLLGAIVIILIGSLVITGIRNGRKASAEAFDHFVSELEDKKSMIDSYLLYDNQEGAKTLIGESLASLDSIEAKGDSQVARKEKIRGEIEVLKAKIQRLTDVGNPELIGNFNTDNPSAETRNLIISGDKAFAADPSGKAIYTLNLKDKTSSSILVSGDINAMDKPVIEDGFIYYLNGNKLIKVDKENGTNSLAEIANLGADDKIDSFQFYNNYLYLLSADANRIYRYSANGSGYGSRLEWISDGTQVIDAVSMGVNADVILLHGDGRITRMYGRKKDNSFSLQVVEPALDSASLLHRAGDKIYVFDKNSKRLLVFNKEGKLDWQYRLSTLNNIKDFALSDDQKTAYILNDNDVYMVSLK